MTVRKRLTRFDGWNDLPVHIWNLIYLKRLGDQDDLSSFLYAKKLGFPCLIVCNVGDNRRLTFFNILNGKTIFQWDINIRPCLCYTVNGCYDGWVTLTQKTNQVSPFNIQLLNPFIRKVRRNLPSSVSELKNVIPSSSSSPSSYDYIAMGLRYDNVLYFCRPSKDYTWIRIRPKFESSTLAWSDVIFYKGNFYALKFSGDVDEVKGLDGSSPTTKLVAEAHPDKPPFYILTTSHHLVESFGELLRVVRLKNNVFMVFKLDFSPCNYKWIEVENLGDCSLFVGSDDNRFSSSVKASDFLGCRENSIYYILNSKEQPRYGLGIFSLKDGTTQRVSLKGIEHDTCIKPIWYKFA